MQTTSFIPTAIRVAKSGALGIQNVPQAENPAAPGIQLLAAFFIGSVDNSPVCVSTSSCGATPSASGVNLRRDGRNAPPQGLFPTSNHQWEYLASARHQPRSVSSRIAVHVNRRVVGIPNEAETLVSLLRENRGRPRRRKASGKPETGTTGDSLRPQTGSELGMFSGTLRRCHRVRESSPVISTQAARERLGISSSAIWRMATEFPSGRSPHVHLGDLPDWDS